MALILTLEFCTVKWSMVVTPDYVPENMRYIRLMDMVTKLRHSQIMIRRHRYNSKCLTFGRLYIQYKSVLKYVI